MARHALSSAQADPPPQSGRYLSHSDEPVAYETANDVIAKFFRRMNTRLLNQSQFRILSELMRRIDPRMVSREGNPIVRRPTQEEFLSGANVKRAILQRALRRLDKEFGLIEDAKIEDEGFEVPAFELILYPRLLPPTEQGKRVFRRKRRGQTGDLFEDLQKKTQDGVSTYVDTPSTPVDEARAPVDTSSMNVDSSSTPVDEARAPVDTSSTNVDRLSTPVDSPSLLARARAGANSSTVTTATVLNTAAAGSTAGADNRLKVLMQIGIDQDRAIEMILDARCTSARIDFAIREGNRFRDRQPPEKREKFNLAGYVVRFISENWKGAMTPQEQRRERQPDAQSIDEAAYNERQATEEAQEAREFKALKRLPIAELEQLYRDAMARETREEIRRVWEFPHTWERRLSMSLLRHAMYEVLMGRGGPSGRSAPRSP